MLLKFCQLHFNDWKPDEGVISQEKPQNVFKFIQIHRHSDKLQIGASWIVLQKALQFELQKPKTSLVPNELSWSCYSFKCLLLFQQLCMRIGYECFVKREMKCFHRPECCTLNRHLKVTLYY